MSDKETEMSGRHWYSALAIGIASLGLAGLAAAQADEQTFVKEIGRAHV